MSLHHIRLDDIAPEAWRNGGGLTRTLLTWPQPEDWTLRVSVADILGAGPFSPWPAHWRGLAVLEGAGVRLRFGERQQTLVLDGPPLSFDGASAPHCEPLDGPTRDLNLMVDLGAGEGCMAWAAAVGLPPSAPWRGLYTHGPAWLLRGNEPPLAIDGPSLLWSDDDPHPWQLARATAAAYWLTLVPRR